MEKKDKKLIGNVLKKAGELFWDKPSEQALLTGYRSCQQDNNSLGTTYWTISGIFISISFAILGGLLYTMISNNELIKAILGITEGTNNSEMVSYVKLIVPMICIFMVLILFLLRLWLRRFRFIQQVNYDRMREIEKQLGMWKSWRIHGIDHWEKDHFDNKALSNEDMTRLLEYKPTKWWIYWRDRKRYATRSGYYYDGIFFFFTICVGCSTITSILVW